MSSDEAFREEQEKLGRVWNCLGFEKDVPEVNDWFKSSIGGRSIFVQRFEHELRGFENVCPHRFHPIRTEERGNDPIVCAFHQWRYNAEGQAIGIPKCEQMYGKRSRELHACLSPVELALCGGLIFGRFGNGGNKPSLQEWLGPSYDILRHLSANLDKGGVAEFRVRAHWKLMMAITLDDYHIVAVHPSTFGKKGFLPANQINYFRSGVHSAFIPNAEPNALETMAQECKEQRFVPKGYAIFQLFPTFIAVIIPATRVFGDDYWYCLVQHMMPEAHNQTLLRTRFFSMPFARPAGLLRKAIRKLTCPVVNFVFGYYLRKIHKEDNLVCENIQRVSHQINADMLFSNQEQRIEWFEEEYAKLMKDQDSDVTDSG